MKIAIFHNYLDNIGGAEIVTLTLARELKADIYTTNIDWEKIDKMGFSDVQIKSLGRVPINPPLKQQFSSDKFRKLNLGKKYDFYIISGDWALSGVVNNKPNLCYIHAPIRELWDLYEYTRKNIVPWYGRVFFDLWATYNRRKNKKYLLEADKIVCNSENTKQRIKTYIFRDARVIYPPVNTSAFYYKSNGNYWLSVNRLLNNKQIDLQIEAFRRLPKEKLILVGSYEKATHFKRYLNHLIKIKPKNVQLLHWVDSKKLSELYANCKGFITTSKNEDFGMTAVEAMASGKPVIAPNEGGYKESVLDGVTGELIKDLTPEKLIYSIKKIGKNPKKFKNACIKRAKKYSTTNFIKQIKDVIGYDKKKKPRNFYNHPSL